MIHLEITGAGATLQHIREMCKEIPKKETELLRKLSDMGAEEARVDFYTAQYDGDNDVKVLPPEFTSENEVRIVAQGQAVGFIEFGTGIYYTQTHPKAEEFGAIRGGYGYGLGKFEKWRYKGNPGTNGRIIPSNEKHAGEIETHGNPPARAMYEAGKKIREEVVPFAKEVFRR